MKTFAFRMFKRVSLELKKFTTARIYHLGETDVNECESMPCQNNGECVDLIGRYQCRCSGTGFEGVNCKMYLVNLLN